MKEIVHIITLNLAGVAFAYVGIFASAGKMAWASVAFVTALTLNILGNTVLDS